MKSTLAKLATPLMLTAALSSCAPMMEQTKRLRQPIDVSAVVGSKCELTTTKALGCLGLKCSRKLVKNAGGIGELAQLGDEQLEDLILGTEECDIEEIKRCLREKCAAQNQSE